MIEFVAVVAAVFAVEMFMRRRSARARLVYHLVSCVIEGGLSFALLFSAAAMYEGWWQTPVDVARAAFALALGTLLLVGAFVAAERADQALDEMDGRP